MQLWDVVCVFPPDKRNLPECLFWAGSLAPAAPPAICTAPRAVVPKAAPTQLCGARACCAVAGSVEALVAADSSD